MKLNILSFIHILADMCVCVAHYIIVSAGLLFFAAASIIDRNFISEFVSYIDNLSAENTVEFTEIVEVCLLSIALIFLVCSVIGICISGENVIERVVCAVLAELLFFTSIFLVRSCILSILIYGAIAAVIKYICGWQLKKRISNAPPMGKAVCIPWESSDIKNIGEKYEE